MKVLVVKVAGGLCNRLRTIAIYKTIAEHLDRHFLLVWPIDKPMCFTSFDSLFDNDFLITPMMEASLRTTTYKEININYGIRGATQYAGRCNASMDYYKDEHKLGWLPTIKEDTLIVNTICKFKPKFIDEDIFESRFQENLNDLTLKHNIEKSVIDFVGANFSEDIVGVHIRRTDRKECFEKSPDALFIERIKESDKKHFLATDSIQTQEKFQKSFGDQICVYRKTFTNDPMRPSTGIDAAIDLMLLSKTASLLGSYGSSFSYIASRFRGIPFEEVSV